MDNIFAEIKKTVEENKVVLYMKGTKDFPQCGFSATVVQILRNLNVNFVDINVLTNPEIREGIKEFSDWPTIPQLYVAGEFVGGCDIVKEMFQAQELQELLKDKKII
jgi:monothiol glutaredoxin